MLNRVFSRAIFYRGLGLGVAIALSSCQGTTFSLPDRWETYRNPRYAFEFPYPSGWQATTPPENRDGIAFSSPDYPGVEIRGWASFARAKAPAASPVASKSPAPAKPNSSSAKPTPSVSPSPTVSSTIASPTPKPATTSETNFTTDQGVSGILQAKLEAQTSSLTLTLNRNNVQYYWRGSAPSSQFDSYYRFFNYIAKRYRIPDQ